MAERSIAEILKAQENILDELFVVIADEFEVLRTRRNRYRWFTERDYGSQDLQRNGSSR